MNRFTRTAVVASIAVVALGAVYVLNRPSTGVGAPAITPGAPPGPLAASTGPIAFQSGSFAVPLSLTLDDGWTLAVDARPLVDLLHGTTDLGIMQMASVTLPGATGSDPYIPFPADVVAWVSQRPEFGPVTQREVTVGGRKGTLVDADFTWDGTDRTEVIRYSTGAWLYDRGTAGQRGRFIVLPGDGDTGVVIFMEGYIDGWEATAASLDRLLATVVFR